MVGDPTIKDRIIAPKYLDAFIRLMLAYWDNVPCGIDPIDVAVDENQDSLDFVWDEYVKMTTSEILPKDYVLVNDFKQFVKGRNYQMVLSQLQLEGIKSEKCFKSPHRNKSYLTNLRLIIIQEPIK
jgi:hypothetical protein